MLIEEWSPELKRIFSGLILTSISILFENDFLIQLKRNDATKDNIKINLLPQYFAAAVGMDNLGWGDGNGNSELKEQESEAESELECGDHDDTIFSYKDREKVNKIKAVHLEAIHKYNLSLKDENQFNPFIIEFLDLVTRLIEDDPRDVLIDNHLKMGNFFGLIGDIIEMSPLFARYLIFEQIGIDIEKEKWDPTGKSVEFIKRKRNPFMVIICEINHHYINIIIKMVVMKQHYTLDNIKYHGAHY